LTRVIFTFIEADFSELEFGTLYIARIKYFSQSILKVHLLLINLLDSQIGIDSDYSCIPSPFTSCNVR